MINIDSVYQKVLVLTNKEQRGYITPQEFNLLANQAQMEIFEQYFYDMEQLKRRNDDNYEYGTLDTLFEKIAIFEISDRNIIITAGTPFNLARITMGNFYKFGSISVNYNNNGLVEAERVTIKQSKLLQKSPLTAGSITRPYCVLQQASAIDNQLSVRFLPNVAITDPANPPTASISYIRTPFLVSWGYVVVTSKALFDPNPNKTTHFELHPSDEVELVYKILKLAGVTIQREDIASAGQGLEAAQIQQEKQ